MKPQYFAAAVGAVLIVVGLFLGLSSSSVDNGRRTEMSCGSPFSPDDAAIKRADDGNAIYSTLQGARQIEEGSVAAACDDAFGGKAGIAWALIGVGAIALIGGLVVRTKPAAPAATP